MSKIIIDTREQNPFIFEDYEVVSKALNAGDYSIDEAENEIAIERKSVADAVSTVITGHERFREEVLRAKKNLKYFAIVIEGNIKDLKDQVVKEWSIHNSSKLDRMKNHGILVGQIKTVLNTYLGWSVKYNIPVFFSSNRDEAARTTLSLLEAYEKYKKKGEIL